jgi:hypothetical protein
MREPSSLCFRLCPSPELASLSLVLFWGAVKLDEYLTNFQWDVERFDGGDPLPDLARRLQAIADKIDSDIRGFVSSYTEKKQTLAALARRQTCVLRFPGFCLWAGWGGVVLLCPTRA